MGLDLSEGVAPEFNDFVRFGGEPDLGYDPCFRFDWVRGREGPDVLHVEELGFGWEGGDLRS